jgi:UDP-N-acetylmuramoyl-tripeptide--D-alanyl-D-alanine ligase
MLNILKIEDLYSIYTQNPKISTDSRKVEKGVMYFALKGDRFDGNAFASQAIADGASFAVIDNTNYYIDSRTILVEDVLKTLQLLANYHIKSLNIPVLAITGTNGKTTSKELIKSVLSQKYNVLSTVGNLNNHIGVPLTILSVSRNHNFVVIEMGANHIGEIAQLCEIAEPSYGLITNIGKAHLEGFGGFDGVIKAKSELYKFIVNRKGTVFYNSDNDILENLLKNNAVTKIGYGLNNDLLCYGRVVSTNPFVSIEATINNNTLSEKLVVNTHLVGSYNLENVLAAITIGNYFGVPGGKIIKAIENYIPVNNRSQLTKTDKNTLLLDCYNANPSSIDAALKNLVQIPASNKLALLGDMLELGAESEKEHVNVLNFLKENNISAILTGPIFEKLSKQFGFLAFKNSDELYDYLKLNIISDSLILIKGSRGIKLEKIVELL